MYARLNDGQIDKQLLLGRRYFETDLYRNVVVPECKTIEHFEVRDLSDLEILSSLPNVTSIVVRDFSDSWSDVAIYKSLKVNRLIIHSADSIKDLSILQFYPNLKYLSILRCENVEDFSAISDCKELTEISIYSLAVTSLDFIRPLKKLEFVDLAESTELVDVKALKLLSRLKVLYLPYSYLYDDLPLSFSELEVDIDLGFIDDSGPSEDDLFEIALLESYED